MTIVVTANFLAVTIGTVTIVTAKLSSCDDRHRHRHRRRHLTKSQKSKKVKNSIDIVAKLHKHMNMERHAFFTHQVL